MAQDQVTLRSKQAFKLLIDHGADLNRVWFGWERGPENALMSVLIYCHDDRAIKMLLDLGADRSPHLAGVERKYAPLQVATYLAIIDSYFGGRGSIEAVRILAHGGFNDLRGTRAESTLRSICVEPKNRARCKEVASIVRLNPGMIPDEVIDTRPNMPQPREFSTYREVCSFPELRFVADYDFVAIAASSNLWPDAGYQIGPAHPVSVTVNFPGKPVILYLEGEEPTVWTLRRTAATKIIGVVVGKPYEADRRGRQHAIAGIDTNVPIFIGRCAGWVSFSHNQQPRLRAQNVIPDSLDPFTRANNAKFFVLLSDNAVIGDALPTGIPTISSSTLTSEDVGVEQPRKKARKALQQSQ